MHADTAPFGLATIPGHRNVKRTIPERQKLPKTGCTPMTERSSPSLKDQIHSVVVAGAL